jgi:carbon storage regulator
MLVLSRERGETVNIGDEIEVTVIDIRGDKVRLGVSAPRHVAVHRKEVYEAIKRQQKEASSQAAPPDAPAAAGGSQTTSSPPPAPDQSPSLKAPPATPPHSAA